ncbi:MAG: DUF1641 domain-containing protein [Thermodesulfobacteriota bacterium]
MDEALILERLDKLSEEIHSLKSGMLQELKQDLVPILNQATPKVMSFMSELEGQMDNEDLALLVKNILLNVRNLNQLLEMLKAGMELKEDLGPVIKQAAPKATAFMAGVEGTLDKDALVDLLRKTMANLEHFGSAMDMLKAGMELKDDLAPIGKAVLPKVTSFFAEMDGQVDPAALGLLLRKTLTNLDHLNAAMDMLKAGMELKDDLAPIGKAVLPKVTSFFAEMDGQLDSAALGDLVRKAVANLENFSAALDMLKAGMELKDDLAPIGKAVLPKVTSFFAEMDGQLDPAVLGDLVRKAVANLENFSAALDMLKAGMELKDDLAPIGRAVLPKVTSFFAEMDGQFDPAVLGDLVRKAVANLENFSAALDMLKAGMELKDDMAPILKAILPKVTAFFADLDGQVDLAVLPSLLRKLMVNLDNFDRLLAMVGPGMELADELGRIARQADVVTKLVQLLSSLEQRGVFRVIGRIAEATQGFKCSENQLNRMCAAISEVELGAPAYVGPFEMVNEIRDPNVQETLGFAFKIMRAVGCCLRANRIHQLEHEFPDELPGGSVHSESCA